jgi:methionyl aminopeptidase
MIELKNVEQLRTMTEGGAILASCRDQVLAAAQSGVTTLELDTLAEKLIRRAGATPNFKGYGGFPYTICANVNELILHGFPKKRALQIGDVFSLDIGLLWQGLHVDTTGTIVVGGTDKAPEAVQKFVKTGQKALYAAIDRALVGNRVGDISSAIQYMVEQAGYSVIREFVGHGLGSELHMEPMIPCYGRAGTGMVLKEGMTLAIEVMMNMGGPGVKTLKDEWQVVTKDKSLSAQFEQTVAVTKSGPVVLTQ